MRALYTAASGMTAQQSRLDTIANNLANVSTTGFKKSRDAFQDLFYQELSGGGGEGEQAGSRLELGGGVKLAGIERDQAQGALIATNNPLHVAIQGDAMFVVETLDGEPMYTRDGSFTKDPDGYLVTTSGMRVSGDVQIPEEADTITIGYDGTVHGLVSATGQDLVLGQIEIARFVNPGGLMARGGNLFVPTPQSGDAQPLDAGTDVQLVQGYLEGSNVDVASELIDMIQAQRVYELNSKVIQAADDTLQVAANLRR
ncbi:MAG: flagellar basal-body rod protein FlgG [Myxococcota bacterium]